MFRIETYVLMSIIALASVAGGYAMTSSNAGLAAGYVVKVDFDQTFVDAAAGHRELVTTSINRTNKGDRLSVPAGSITLGLLPMHTRQTREDRIFGPLKPRASGCSRGWALHLNWFVTMP